MHAPGHTAVVGDTPRSELACVARSAALALPGVVGVNAGPNGAYVTTHSAGPLDGVVAAAQGDGRFSLDLFLTAGLVALHPLGQEVCHAVAAAARSADLGDRLGGITVTFLDVAGSGGEQ